MFSSAHNTFSSVIFFMFGHTAFSDAGIKQIISGYHDDMRNLDANFAFYNESSAKVQKSIIGFMFLIWHRPEKSASYDDMDDVVKRICEELPGKWPQDVCEALAE